MSIVRDTGPVAHLHHRLSKCRATWVIWLADVSVGHVAWLRKIIIIIHHLVILSLILLSSLELLVNCIFLVVYLLLLSAGLLILHVSGVEIDIILFVSSDAILVDKVDSLLVQVLFIKLCFSIMKIEL